MPEILKFIIDINAFAKFKIDIFRERESGHYCAAENVVKIEKYDYESKSEVVKSVSVSVQLSRSQLLI